MGNRVTIKTIVLKLGPGNLLSFHRYLEPGKANSLRRV